MDKSGTATIASGFADVCKYGQSGQYDKALKAVNRILNLSPNEEKAVHCKIICLIQLLRFEEAYQLIIKSNSNSLIFERAYCEYRLGEPEKALHTIDNGCEVLTPDLSELRAQILYRLEKFEDCMEAYKDILKHTHDDYESERKTNFSAVAASLKLDFAEFLPGSQLDTYEFCYNKACSLANMNKYVEAENILKLSEKLCLELLEEDGASNEDYEEEMLIIRLQLAYCLHMQGKTKEASAIYTDALKCKSSDGALLAVASNNLIALNKEQNMFDSKKKMKIALGESCQKKLTRNQKRIIVLNNCLLSLYTSSGDQCRQLCNKFVHIYPEIAYEFIRVQCTSLIKEKKFKEAIELLDNFGEKNVEFSNSCKFGIVQLHLLNGNRKAAVDVIFSLNEVKYRPGIVSALVTLLLGLGDNQKASNILKECVDWYKSNNINSADLAEMWRKAADFHLRDGEPRTAASSLEELLKANSKDMKILAQLVIAYAHFDTEKAQNASKKLPVLETLTTTSEIDSLEATNWMMGIKAAKKAVKLEQSPSTPGLEVQIKKRSQKRVNKKAKSDNPSTLLDPERWLPKYERSAYKKKRDRRTKEVVKGSQGMTSGSVDLFDMTKPHNITSTKVTPTVPVLPESTPVPRHQQRKSLQKKKKNRH